MLDIGQNFFEERVFYFNRLSIFRIIINPSVKGYPPLFLICKGKFGAKVGAFGIALSFLQLNRLMMGSMPNADRLLLAEHLTDYLIPNQKSGEIKVDSIFGGPLILENLDLTTKVHHFRSDDLDATPLYYFQLADS